MDWSDPYEAFPILASISAAFTAVVMLVLMYIIFPATGLSSPPLHIGLLIACIFAVVMFCCSVTAGLVAHYLEREYPWLFPARRTMAAPPNRIRP